MSNAIQTSYGTQTYSVPTRAYETKRAGTQADSFLAMAAQLSRSGVNPLTGGMSGIMGMAGLPTSLMMDLSALSASQVQRSGAEATEAISLEDMLKAMLYFNGVDSVSISKRLGHAQVSTTANIYAHVMEEADQRNADILADVFLKKA